MYISMGSLQTIRKFHGVVRAGGRAWVGRGGGPGMAGRAGRRASGAERTDHLEIIRKATGLPLTVSG